MYKIYKYNRLQSTTEGDITEPVVVLVVTTPWYQADSGILLADTVTCKRWRKFTHKWAFQLSTAFL